MKQFVIGVMLVLLAVGCHSQVPPAPPGYQVNLSWTPAAASGNWAGCTTGSPCVYAVYAETLATGVSSCDPTTSTNYKEITTSATRPSGSSYVDPNTTGLTKCYDVETVRPARTAAHRISPARRFRQESRSLLLWQRPPRPWPCSRNRRCRQRIQFSMLQISAGAALSLCFQRRSA